MLQPIRLSLRDRPSSNLASSAAIANPIRCASVRFPPIGYFQFHTAIDGTRSEFGFQSTQHPTAFLSDVTLRLKMMTLFVTIAYKASGRLKPTCRVGVSA